MHLKFVFSGLGLLLLSAVTALSQGQLIFNNRVANLVVSPVYGFQIGDSQAVRQGNTTNGLPPGAQVYTGSLLSGTGFTAQLFGGSTRAVVGNLQPLFPTTSFRSNQNAGFVAPPNIAVTIPDVPEGASAKVVLRAWDNRGGSVSNWHQVAADPTVARGESVAFLTPPLGGFSHAPPNLVGLESFNLFTGAVENLSFKINFQPGDVSAPAGYLVDSGLLFGPREGGFRYGWNLDHAARTRDRDAPNAPDQRYDTFIEMDPTLSTTWEVELVPGVYGIHLVAGDPTTFEGVYRLAVEGTLILQGVPEAGRNWVVGDGIVDVTDGRLTLAHGPGAVSNRVCFIEVTRVSPPRLSISSPAPGFAPLRFTGEPGLLYQIQASTNFVSWVELGVATNQQNNLFEFDFPFTAPHQFFRTRTLPWP